MTESSFLAAVRADPDDRLLRLAFADWLEESDDSRSELIRIEEEMRRLPVFADRFWELKPRRNELRATLPPEWLAAMRYGTVCEPVFRHGLPDGWRERWRLIREFVERWCRIPMPDVGGRGDEIREAETRLGRTLPPSVREYVAFAHDVHQDEDFVDVFRDAYQMVDLAGCAALSLLLQCEGDHHWAILHADLGGDDPRVSEFLSDFDTQDQTFIPHQRNPTHPTVTSFVLDYTFSYTNGIGGGFGTEIRDANPLLRDLEATYPVQAVFGKTRIFEGDDIYVRVAPNQGRPGHLVVVELSAAMPREAIPEYLWNLTHQGGSFHGMFIPERHNVSLAERTGPHDIPV